MGKTWKKTEKDRKERRDKYSARHPGEAGLVLTGKEAAACPAKLDDKYNE